MGSKGDGKIWASAKHDPGLRDIFHCVEDNIKAHRHEVMDNVKSFANEGDYQVVSEYPEEYPATDHLFEIKCSYKMEGKKRNYVLDIEDMEIGYATYVNHCIPQVKALTKQFRELKLPIIWTNWARRSDDGLYNGLDRYYGSQGVDNETNPCYIFGENGIDTVPELAPINEEEMSRSIVSMHLSKFADLDEDGREILFPMLEAWGTNTIVLCGAWTDDCLATTVFDAVDKYGYDLILVNNGCATASIHGNKMMDVLYGSTSCDRSAEEIIKHLQDHPELIEEPKAPLNGNVRHTKNKYRHDPLLDEVEALRKRVTELEAKLASK